MSVKDADGHKLQFHPKRVVEWLENGTCGPLHAEVGITNKCNHTCIFCTLNWVNHGRIDIDTEVMLNAIKDMSDLGVKSIYFAGEGEPTLHKDFIKFVNYAAEVGMKVSLSTNGAKFTREVAKQTLPNLSWVRFSVDAGTEKTYAKIHGVSEKEFSKVIKNIEETCKIKKELNCTTDIGVQTLLMPDNIEEIETLAHISKRIKVDNFQVKPCHHHPKSAYNKKLYTFIHDSLESQLKKLENDDFIVVVRTKSIERLLQDRTYDECHGFHFYALIDAKGNITPCNIFYDNEELIYGNLYKETFKEIWNGKNRLNIIDKITNTCHQHCGEYRCRLDVLNRYLQRVKFPERNDEFI